MPEYGAMWGSDTPVSMPEPIDDETVLVDLGSHVFTPYGMRLKMTSAVRSEMVANAYSPVDGGES